MPTYDYICLNCRKRFDVFMSYKEYGVKTVFCSHCQSAEVKRRPPRVRMLHSDEARLSAMADPSKLAGLEDDPRAMGKMFREMGGSLGEEMPPQFDEIVDRLEAGQSAEEIESAMPDWTGGNEHPGRHHSQHD